MRSELKKNKKKKQCLNQFRQQCDAVDEEKAQKKKKKKKRWLFCTKGEEITRLKVTGRNNDAAKAPAPGYETLHPLCTACVCVCSSFSSLPNETAINSMGEII